MSFAPLREQRIAYFSMEIALHASMPTYAGGLGVLAGDTVRSAADLGLRFVAVTLLHRHGYFAQVLDARGQQSEEPVSWTPEDFCVPLDPRVKVGIESRDVWIRAWRYRVDGVGGAEVQAYLLDTNLPENSPEDRRLTDHLYGGSEQMRLSQEIVLGIGGVKMLRALGYAELDRLHLNEGHAALAVLALLEERDLEPPAEADKRDEHVAAVRRHCVFTTHTPVPAGHDKFPAALARRQLGERRWRWLAALGDGESLNLTELALRASRFVNGVAMRHGEVSRGMFPHYPIRSITNGIHAATWCAPSFRLLFDRHIPEWRRDPFSLRYVVGLPGHEIWEAHIAAKQALLQRVNAETRAGFEEHVLTLGFARRATAYKRPALVFRDVGRLAAIARRSGALQIVFAGKAHPHDAQGKALIREVFAAAQALRGRVAVAYLANHDMRLGRLLCAGTDVWLNNPIPPLEASGTSGMKAALNGVPSLSIRDGWWVEGCIEGITGWAVDGTADDGSSPEARDDAHAAALLDKLASTVLPCFYGNRERFVESMRHAIATNASFFNTHRMLLEYLYEAYQEPAPACP
jgi:glycogen phosphorylase